MPEYRVRWEIDLDAPDAKAAAKLALEIHRDCESVATAFDVFDKKGKKTSVVLEGYDCEPWMADEYEEPA